MSKNHAARCPRLKHPALLLAAALLTTGTAEAVWEAVPEIELQARTNDNPSLEADFDEDASSTQASALVTLRSFSQRGNFYVRPRVSSSRYADSQFADLESTNYSLRTLGEYEWQRASVGFSTDYRNESIIDAELVDVIPEDPDVPDPVESETGRLVLLSQDRERFFVEPYVDLDLSERSAVRLGARYIDTAYSGPGGITIGRTDFTETRFQAGIVRNVDERNEVTAQIFASEYEAEGTGNVTDTTGAEGIFNRVLSESWNMNLTAGVRRSDYRIGLGGSVLDSADTSFTFDLGFRKRTERTTLNLNVGKTVTPSGTGFLVERDQIRVYARHLMTQRVAAFGGLRVSQTSAVDDADPRSERDYTRANGGIEWQMARQMYLRFAYGYTFQEFAEAPDRDAEANELTVSFRYQGLSRR